MSLESPSFNESIRRKRTAAAILLGVSTLSLMTACATEAPTSAPSQEQPRATEQARSGPELPAVSLLKKYERETGVAPRMMEFITMPSTEDEAREQATTMAETLKSWNESDASPIVIMEPTINSGDSVDLHKLAEGGYDAALTTYFSSLHEAGITSEQMGTWVPLPEPNIPEWDNGVTDPELFSRNITKVAGAIKKQFPETHVSIMLDSTTYPKSPDPEWTSGTTDPTELLPYLNVQPGLIDSFGLQGFTWSATDTPAEYLNGDAAVAAANKLGVKHVWFNTGTYAKTFNPDDENTPLTATTARRGQVLSDVLTQAEAARQAGFTVDMINVFGENNFDGSDGSADFSYTTPENIAVLKTFVGNAKAKSIPVTIFDAPKS